MNLDTKKKCISIDTKRKRFLFSFWAFLCSMTLVYALLVDRRAADFSVASDLIAVGMFTIPTFYFGYKKRGTGWLGFMLFYLPFFFLHSELGMDRFKDIEALILACTWDFKYLLYVSLCLLSYSYFWISCLLLRNANKIGKKAKSIPILK